MENSEYLITEECRELIRQVQLAKENRIEEVTVRSESLFEQIEVYKLKCIQKYNQIEGKETLQQTEEKINQINSSIAEHKAYLSRLDISDKKSAVCNEKITELIESVQKEREKIKILMFNNQMLKFQANRSEICDNILGCLKYETIAYTVI